MAAHVGRKVAEKPSGDERLQGIGRQSQQRARQSHEQHHLNRRVGRTRAVGIAEILPYHHRSAYGKGRKQTVKKGNNEVHQRHARNGSLANAGHHNGVDNAHSVMQQQFARYRQEQQQYVAIREVYAGGIHNHVNRPAARQDKKARLASAKNSNRFVKASRDIKMFNSYPAQPRGMLGNFISGNR